MPTWTRVEPLGDPSGICVEFRTEPDVDGAVLSAFCKSFGSGNLDDVCVNLSRLDANGTVVERLMHTDRLDESVAAFTGLADQIVAHYASEINNDYWATAPVLPSEGVQWRTPSA